MVKSSRERAIEAYIDVRDMYEGVNSVKPIINEAEMLLMAGDDDAVVKLLGALPTEKQLFDGVVSKLGRDNAVTKTLKKVLDDPAASKVSVCKALFSIGTHAMISVEKGDDRYVALARLVAKTVESRLRKGVVGNHGCGGNT